MKSMSIPMIHINLNQLSSCRLNLMGVATIMILVCHAPASKVLMPEWLAHVCNLGNYGVDIFLLLSGLGCYYSLKKQSCNEKLGGASWIKRRFRRILGPYIIVYLPYCMLFFLIGKYGIGDCLLCLSAVEYWFFHRGAWFVSLILILYLLSPLLYRMFIGKMRWVLSIIIILILACLSNIHMVSASNTNVIHNIQNAFSRVPCFILGMVVAQNCMDNIKISPVWLLVLAALGFLLRKIAGLDSGMEWTLVPIIIYIVLIIMNALNKVGLIDGILRFLGKISLESYLTNITINSALVAFIPTYISSPLFYGRWIEYTIVIVIGLMAAYGVHQLNHFIRQEPS